MTRKDIVVLDFNDWNQWEVLKQKHSHEQLLIRPNGADSYYLVLVFLCGFPC